MKKYLVIIIILFPHLCFSQSDSVLKSIRKDTFWEINYIQYVKKEAVTYVKDRQTGEVVDSNIYIQPLNPNNSNGWRHKWCAVSGGHIVASTYGQHSNIPFGGEEGYFYIIHRPNFFGYFRVVPREAGRYEEAFAPFFKTKDTISYQESTTGLSIIPRSGKSVYVREDTLKIQDRIFRVSIFHVFYRSNGYNYKDVIYLESQMGYLLRCNRVGIMDTDSARLYYKTDYEVTSFEIPKKKG
jgi:hypothetical protein